MKTCYKCGQEWPLDQFQIVGRYALNSCKQCRKAYHAEYHQQRKLGLPKPIPTTKRCNKCGEEKPLDAFPARREGDKLYLKSWCKHCFTRYLSVRRSAKRKERRESQGLLPRGTRPPTSTCERCHQEKPIADFLDAKKRIRRLCSDCLHTPLPIPTERQCTQCGLVKPISEFGKNKGRYPKSWCKPCSRAKQAEWYLDHPEEKRMHSTNASNMRRARLRKVKTEKIDRLALYKRDHWTCYLCGCLCTRKNITLDHVIPLFLGGTHTADNLRVACRSCNSRKGTKAPQASSEK